ncbi:hypothetical protein ACFLW8_02265 [Chloroflexota bacterium]
MGTKSVYRCLDCGNEFTAREGGGFNFIEYRCVDCDTIKAVRCNSRIVPPGEWTPLGSEEISVCPKCGGELRRDIGPMCQKCKSRNVECIEDILNYD